MTLSRSPGVVLLKGLFLTKQVILLRTLFPTTRAWGAPLPYTPLGDEVREGAPLSRSPGAVLAESFVPGEAGAIF